MKPRLRSALIAGVVLMSAISLGCKTSVPLRWDKVKLDLAQLDSKGLRGPRDGKVALSYEFSIPDSDRCRAEVQAIDPEIQFMPGSRGRSGGGAYSCLCIGETRADFRDVLGRLAALPYVTEIRECYFK